MKIKYDRMRDKLLKGGKVVKKADIMKCAASYIIEEINCGRALADYPIDSKTLPLLHEVLSFIGGDIHLSEKLSKAEKGRLAIVKENMIKYSQVYAKNPSKENQDIFQALERTYSNLSKQQKNDGTFIVNYHSPFPEDFWTKEVKWEQDEC